MVFLLILLILVVLAEVITLALRCRRGHPELKYFRLWRYAHRGLHHQPDAPENSLSAFRAAAERRYGAELDVHLTRDGRLAVIHDSSLRRTAGADVRVEDLTAEELKRYRLEGTAEPIPLLEEVLPIFAGGPPLIVELKSEGGNHDRLAAAAAEALAQSGVRYCVESFDPRCLRWLRRNRPNIVRGQLSQHFGPGDGGLPWWQRVMLGNLLMNFLSVPDFIAYRFSDRNSPALRWCRRFYRAQEVNWTIRTPEELAQAEQAGNLVIFEGFDPRNS